MYYEDEDWREKIREGWGKIIDRGGELWDQFKKTSKRTKEIIVLGFLCLLLFFVFPAIFATIPQLNGVSTQIINSNTMAYRPTGYDCSIEISNNGFLGKGLIVNFFNEVDGVQSKYIFLNSGESKNVTINFGTEKIGEKQINIEVNWGGLFNWYQQKIADNQNTIEVLGADYHITILNDRLNKAENNLFSFRIKNEGNIKADAVDIQLTNLGKLQLEGVQTKTLQNFNVSNESVVSFTISVPSKEFSVGETVDLIIKIETLYPNCHEVYNYYTSVQIQENSSVTQIEEAIVVLIAVGGLIGAFYYLTGKKS